MEELINKLLEPEFRNKLLESGLTVALGAAIFKVFLNGIINNRKLRKVWKCQTRRSELSRYLIYLFICYGCIFIYPILAFFAFPEYSQQENKELFILGCISVSLLSNLTLLLLTTCYIWKRLKNFIKYAVVYLVIILSFVNSILYYNHFLGERESLYLCGSALVLELIGLKVFDNVFVWEYNKVKIFILNNNNVIEAKSSDISNKGEWFIVTIPNENNNMFKELRIPSEQVFKLEFYDKQF